MDTAKPSERLSFTIFLAIAVHAIIIFGIGFSKSPPHKLAPTLNITLANYKSRKEPDKADFLAQYNQEASGVADDVRELSTPEHAELSDTRINEINPLPQQLRKSSERKPSELITTASDARPQYEVQQAPDKQQDDINANESFNNQEQLKRKLASLRAQYDLKSEEMARKPRVKHHTSVSAKSSPHAAYYNEWSQKIIRVGNQNFPEEALRKKIYGSLRMSVRIGADGNVLGVQILESSGHKILDDAARRIVNLASPFAPFPPEIRAETDIFEFIRTWYFDITGLSTRD